MAHFSNYYHLIYRNGTYSVIRSKYVPTDAIVSAHCPHIDCDDYTNLFLEGMNLKESLFIPYLRDQVLSAFFRTVDELNR